MFSTVRIAPSILSANFMDMERDIRMLEEAGADIIHVDVMDGHFVPNLTIGVPFIKQLRAITDLPIDVHLMISNPQEQIDWYLDLDPDYVSVHIEAVPDEDELHALIFASGEPIQRSRSSPICPSRYSILSSKRSI